MHRQNGRFMAEQTITVDLGAPARLADVPELAGRVVAWWLGELKAMSPAWVLGFLPREPTAATLHVRGDVWRVACGGDEGRAFELDARADDKDLADQILRAAPDFSLSKLTVVLPHARALKRRATFPLMSERELRSAVELQIDRLTPFKADAVRFDVRTAARDAGAGTLEAEIAIVPDTAVAAVEKRLTGLGLKPAAVDIDGGNGAPAGFNLLPAAEASAPPRTILINAAFVCGAAFAWYLAGAAWDMSRTRETEAWQARIAELAPAAKRSAALRAQLDAMAQPFAVARAHKPGLTLDVLSELTRLIPDTARLTELRLTGSSVDIVGLAQDAPALIAKLEASSLFKEVKFRSPVMRRPELNKERFEITMALEGRAR